MNGMPIGVKVPVEQIGQIQRSLPSLVLCTISYAFDEKKYIVVQKSDNEFHEIEFNCQAKPVH